MDWFEGTFTGKNHGKPPYFMGKQLVSGEDVPLFMGNSRVNKTADVLLVQTTRMPGLRKGCSYSAGVLAAPDPEMFTISKDHH